MKKGVYTARNVEKNDARFRCLCVERALAMNNVKYHGKRGPPSIKSARTSRPVAIAGTLSSIHIYPVDSDPSHYN